MGGGGACPELKAGSPPTKSSARPPPRPGAPPGQPQTRAMLTAEEVQANSEAILRQFYKVLDESRTEIRRQSEWFDGFTLTDVVRLAARVTVAQILQRGDLPPRL